MSKKRATRGKSRPNKCKNGKRVSRITKQERNLHELRYRATIHQDATFTTGRM